MGVFARFTVASMVSLAAAGVPLVAVTGGCDEGAKYDPAYPIEGGPTMRPTKDASPIEPRREPDAAVDAGSCAPLGAQVEVRNVLADPNAEPIGGLVADGTYVLTSAVFTDPTKDGGVAFKRAARMTFSGKDLAWEMDTDGAGKPAPTCCSGTWVYQADESVMVMNLTCNGEPALRQEIYDFHPTGIPDGGVDQSDGGAAQIMVHVGELHDIYTKQ